MKTSSIKFFISIALTIVLSLALSAQRDPQWLMPLYFQDANGDRDTVYFGYDPEATMYSDADSILGEEWIRIDTSQFNVYLWNYPNIPGGSFYLINDTVKKVDIRNVSVGAEIGFCKGKLPITMKWVDSMLYSLSCPFPDLSPRPRARIEVTCSDYEGPYNSCNDFDGPPLSLTDYPAPEIPYPITDSMVFDGSGINWPSQVISHLTLSLVAHDHKYVGLKYPEESDLKLYPNPFSEELNIQFKQLQEIKVKILTTTGENLFSITLTSDVLKLDMSGFRNGLYIIQIQCRSDIYIQKIVKSE
jgi:hypothetical protein